MKILIVHNRYQQRGGEDAVVASERDLLAGSGVDVETLEENNDAITDLKGKVEASVSVFTGSRRSNDRVKAMLAGFQPDVVHVHNWFPTVSPSVFWNCHRAGIPVVNTVHNYRLLCVNATFFRDGRVCEDCMGTTLRSPGVIHKCYRDSRAGSAIATAGMLAHWGAGTWHRSVDRFIALSTFARQKLIEGGLPESKILVKPNFVDPDPGIRSGAAGNYLFVGRLTEEKGVRTLIECWTSGTDLPLLTFVGRGPLEDEVRDAAAKMKNVEWLGSRNSNEVSELMGSAKALLCPSLWYEAMPRVVIESMAVGTPVIASRIGSYPEMIVDGESGVLFECGDANNLLLRIRALEATGSLSSMRVGARLKYESEYTGSKNLEQLLGIYEQVSRKAARVSRVPVSVA
jgi:glycosyltransferase involved in cell wall biosynthesis